MVPNTIDMMEMAGRITLTVRGLRGWEYRLWIARMLFRLGARIAGVNIVIED